jgi:hypothetical protein
MADSTVNSARTSAMPLPRLVASSVVRGAELGQSHGGVCILDFASGRIQYVVDWNTTEIDVEGRGGDRGLRGIAVIGSEVYVASSSAVLVFDRHWRLQHCWQNRYLRHCHEIAAYEGRVYVTSTGFDALLAFDLDTRSFIHGLHLRIEDGSLRLLAFDPRTPDGPQPSNQFHLNSVTRSRAGLFFSGLRSGDLLRLSDNRLTRVARLPVGTHNAQPFAHGVIFNDTAADRVCACFPGNEITIPISAPPGTTTRWTHAGDSRLARPLFGRGLCPLSSRYVAGGSSPSTISIYDLQERCVAAQLPLSLDIRNAIHGLALWPFEDRASPARS